MVRKSLVGESRHNVTYIDSKRSRRITDAVHAWENYLCLYELTHLVVQIGVVDSAPRIFSLRENHLIGRIRPRFARRFIISTASKHRAWIVKRRKKVYTKPELFSEMTEKLISLVQSQNVKLAFVAICPTHENLCERSPGFNDNVSKYNSIIKTHTDQAKCGFIEPLKNQEKPDNFLLADGIHINPSGSILFSQSISDWIAENC